MANNVTVVGLAGATVTVPFTSADNYVLAQWTGAPIISALADASKFVATGPGNATTAATGIISNIDGATITGTAAGATVIDGGSGISYTAAGNGQTVYFSATGSGNLLANGAASVGTTYNIDAGGNGTVTGTTLNTTLGTATVNAFYGGYLDIVAGTGKLLVNDKGAGIRITALPAGGNASIIAAGTVVPTPQVTVSGASASLFSDLSLAVQVNAGGAVSLSTNNPFIGGALVTDTVTALSSATVFASALHATINQTSAGNVSLGSAFAAAITLNTAAGATETVTYTGQEGATINAASGDNLTLSSPNNVTVNAGGANVSLTGGGSFLVTGSGNLVNSGAALASIAGTGSVTLAGGTFYSGSGPALTATGSTDTIISSTGIVVTLAGGAAATVQNTPFATLTDTVFATGGTVFANGAAALISQTAAGNLSIGSGAGGQVTVNTAANATEAIAYSNAQSLTVNAASGDALALTGGGSFVINTTGSDTISNVSAGLVSIGGTGTVTLTGGAFYTGAGPALTATGTLDVINSGVGIAVALTNGAAATVQGFAGTLPADTITALGSGSIKVTTATALVNQTAQGNLFLDLSNAGQVSVNAAAGATETIATSTVAGVNANVSLNGGNYSLAGNQFTVAASGSDTIRAGGALKTILNAAASAKLTLAGGLYEVSTTGAGAGLTLGANDTIYFDAGTNPASLMGATTIGLSGSSGFSFDVISTSGTYAIAASVPSAAFHIISLGSTSDVIYIGTPFRTDAYGNVIEEFASNVPSLGITNNIVIWGGTGSQTVFGAGNAYADPNNSAALGGIGNQFYGGIAGNNLLVGALTIVGGGAGDTLVAGAFTQSILASTGNTTLIGGDANAANYLASETLIGGIGSDTFIFGTGAETITGGAGADAFTDVNKTASGTTIAITDFTSGTDKVNLFSLTNASLSGTTANVTGQTNVGGSTFVQLSDGVTIRFAGVASVSSSDFVTNVGTVQVGKIV